MTADNLQPITVYGSSISYFTGKLENYFRIKGVPYSFAPMGPRTVAPVMKRETGSTQVPAIQLGDGRWMTDSTPIIEWFEREYPDPAVYPADPLQRFFSLLLEDYADEWLWRPAMHYRWYYTVGARFASSHLAEELGAEISAPLFLKRRNIIRRQRNGYTTGDGITEDQVPGVEAILHRTLEQLSAIFEQRPFLLGDRPSLADVGFSGPFFRHFALDPVPAEIVRQQAPAVWAWAARLWNSRLASMEGELVSGVPQDWGPILDEIGSHYLPYLCANVDAVAGGRKRFDTEVGGVRYAQARWSPYRVWCLKRLREHFLALPDDARDGAQALLEAHNCWEPLWRQEPLPVADDYCSELPFRTSGKMIDVYDD